LRTGKTGGGLSKKPQQFMGVAKSRHLAIDEPNVRFWSKTDYGLCIIDVRFW
jgi:hypothetical protein